MSYSLSPIQKMAQLITKKHSLTPPVDILGIVEHYADYEEDVIPCNVDAICINKYDKPLIILNPNPHLNRKRFTLAHELGHINIPWHVGMISCHTDTGLTHKDLVLYNSLETEANSFASELLMPSSWVSDIILKYEKNGLEKIVRIVSQEAEVSIYAAIYSVMNLLPPGYVAIVQEKTKDYGNRLESPGTDVLFLYNREGNLDKKWLKECAKQHGEFEAHSYTIGWWNCTRTISDLLLKKVVDQNEQLGLNTILQIISKDDALASILTPVCNLLPAGYILIIQGKNVQRVIKSLETTLFIPTKDGAYEYDFEWLNENATSCGTYNYSHWAVYWWKFVIEMPKTKIEGDYRQSTEIIGEIITDLYGGSLEGKSILRSINGIVGNLNSHSTERDIDTFYKKLKQRFMGRKTMEDVVLHPNFDTFLLVKSREIVSRR